MVKEGAIEGFNCNLLNKNPIPHVFHQMRPNIRPAKRSHSSVTNVQW